MGILSGAVDLSPEMDKVENRRLSLALTITRFTQWVSLALCGAIFVLWLAFPIYIQLLIYAGVLAVMALVSWVYPVLVRQGLVNMGALLYLCWFGTLITVCILLVPEVIPAALVCYVFVVLMSNFFLGSRGFLAYMAASLLFSVLTMIYFYNPGYHLFPSLPYQLGPVVGMLMGAIALAVLSLYIRMIFTTQETLFVSAHAARQEVETKVLQERASHILLQQTITDYLDMMKMVGRGNLSVRIPIDPGAAASGDPLVALGIQLNESIASLEGMINQIRQAAGNLTTSAAEILAAMTQQASGSTEQSAAITQTTTTVQEVRAIAEQSVSRAEEVVSAAQRTVEFSRSGQQAIRDTIEGMNRIKERVEGIALNILTLSEQTQQIGEIIASVNDLASQSNLLALNASVEAARAGEHGKGFSVVALEVRSLAEQSRQATAQVKRILQEIQKATNLSVMATEEGIKVVEQGVSLAEQTQRTVEQLVSVINEAVDRMVQVMAGGNQQKSGIEQVSLAMNSIQQVSVQNLSSTRQSEKAAEDLNHLASRLNKTLALYEIKETHNLVDFPLARLHHKNWVRRMEAFMDGKAHLTVEEVASHTECDLGKWLYSIGLTRYHHLGEIKELEQVHAAFHQGVKEVVRLKEAGQVGLAEREMLAVRRHTERIFALLSIVEQRESGFSPN